MCPLCSPPFSTLTVPSGHHHLPTLLNGDHHRCALEASIDCRAFGNRYLRGWGYNSLVIVADLRQKFTFPIFSQSAIDTNLKYLR